MLTDKEKLEALRKWWGYVEVVPATIRGLGWKIWIVKNYAGKLLDKMDEKGLPGNPKATRIIERSGHSETNAITNAYARERLKQVRTKKTNVGL